MILKEENKDRLIDALIDWHTEAYYNNRSSFDVDDDGNVIGKNYRSFEAMLKIIKRLIRRAKWKPL